MSDSAPTSAGATLAGPQQKWNDMAPRMRLLIGRALVMAMVSALTMPAEWLVPVVRTAAGRRGVHLGPPVTALLAVAAALEVGNRPERESADSEPIARTRWTRLRADAETYAVAAVPALTALVPGLVVLPRRSPLWGWAVSAAGRMAVITVFVVDNERLKRREAAAGQTAGGRRTS